ncbi:MAG TPA: YoaK family protein [Solirubrobacterales bacterium]|jgi:uncharacterized membrane protein YoaK (UPF0700 family)|nr:YoaK family protein [Solirubrobacterales bacterium]
MWDGLTRTLLILTFVTGILDAVSFIALGQVFVAMQTGNVIFLGIGIGGADGAPVTAPLVSLLAFLLGAGAAAFFVRPVDPGHPGALAGPIEIGLIGLATVLAAVAAIEPGEFSAYLLIAILAAAMGLRNTVARRAGDRNVATTVLNLTLTAFASHAPLASADALERRGAAVVAILAGALCGALLVKASLTLALGTAAALVVLAAVTHARTVAPAT